MKIAYLISKYPFPSHTFIQNEIIAMRRLGLEITAISVRKPLQAEVLGPESRTEFQTCRYLLRGIICPSFMGTLLGALLLRPMKHFRAFVFSQQMASPTVRSRILHGIYLIEAILLCSWMTKAGIRHVHVHFGNNSAAVARLARLLDEYLSYSVTIHGPKEFEGEDRALLPSRIEDASFIRCISGFAANQVRQICEAARISPPVHVIHCGIDVANFRPHPSNASEPKKERSFQILSVGRLALQKGYDVLLKALSKLKDRGLRDWKLAIVGAGPEEQNLLQLSNELGLRTSVTFLGAQDPTTVRDLMADVDLFALASRDEGIPVVLMEAMAMERTVIATRITGIPELIEHSLNGFLVAPEDPDALARQIEALLREGATPTERGARARATVLQHFNLEVETGKLKTLFLEAVG